MDWTGLAARAGAMIVRPGRTWDVIGPEPGDARTVLQTYVAPLAAIPAICGALGELVFATRIGEVGVREPPLGVLAKAAAGYATTFAVVWLLAWWIAAIAAPFGGLRERDQALKLAAYSGTVLWLAGVAHLYPNLALPVGILALLYAGWTLYQGLPRMMRSDPAHNLTYFAAVLLGFLLLAVLRATVVAKAAELGGPLMMG
ncbi:Yip1 family protein [Phenylobacterium sp. VNQ135]|uniref:Yip1 family protein n=1 Tax=Phenylobacterium sp. VNQ135 TaxID=3400922 RepID=UPI003C0163A3